MSWTPPKLVKWISNDLEKKGFPSPHRFQAEQLVSQALNISRLDIYLQHDKPCTADEQKKLRELLKRRYRREPTAYILGNCEFWTLRLSVGPGVLIPRPETEILVEVALEKIPGNIDHRTTRILELGTGSAAVPLALCAERPNLEIITTEYSPEALQFAKRNIDQHQQLLADKKNAIMLVQTDKFAAINSNILFDMIVSNPPYIPDNHIQTLQNEVSDWEPKIALAGGKNGADFYDYLMQAASKRLKPGGYLIFEHGYDQAEILTELVKTKTRLKLLEKRKDYAGHDRVLVVQKTG